MNKPASRSRPFSPLERDARTQEGEDPEALHRVSLTVFGRLQSSIRKMVPVAFLRERSSIIPSLPGTRIPTGESHSLAPTVEWTTRDTVLRSKPENILRDAVKRQLNVVLHDYEGTLKLLLAGEYKSSLDAPYHATHFGLFLRQRKELVRFLEHVLLPVQGGRLVPFSEEKFGKQLLRHELTDAVDIGLSRFASKK